MDLRGIRNHGDYDWRRPFGIVNARQAVREAEQLLAILEGSQDQQNLATLKANIRAYERDVLRDITWRAT